jgi:hypothetical protein
VRRTGFPGLSSAKLNTPTREGIGKGKLATEAAGTRTEARKPMGSFKHGGRVKKTGPYKLHRGERVERKEHGRDGGRSRR